MTDNDADTVCYADAAEAQGVIDLGQLAGQTPKVRQYTLTAGELSLAARPVDTAP